MGKFKFYAVKLSAIILLFFLVQVFLNGFTEIFLLNSGAFFQPWRFFTSIFLHGGITHLFYNLFALLLFGSILESLIGERKFMLIFFVTGILANLIAVNFYDSSLGASGAIFGIIGALIVVRPFIFVWAFGLPMPIIVAGILWAIGDVIGIFVPSGTANVAHLFGMFFGLIFGILYRKKRVRRKKQKVVLNEGAIRKWEDGWLR
ncbi:MAG: rhomboid family intramembrane serine protease [Candidatus Pacearchaeota archaeon]|nr:rhomboid family intramembrane serine protease [Candidatus Pacearchaeota archaeon]